MLAAKQIGKPFKTYAGACKRAAFETAHQRVKGKYRHDVQKKGMGEYIVVRVVQEAGR